MTRCVDGLSSRTHKRSSEFGPCRTGWDDGCIHGVQEYLLYVAVLHNIVLYGSVEEEAVAGEDGRGDTVVQRAWLWRRVLQKTNAVK